MTADERCVCFSLILNPSNYSVLVAYTLTPLLPLSSHFYILGILTRQWEGFAVCVWEGGQHRLLSLNLFLPPPSASFFSLPFSLHRPDFATAENGLNQLLTMVDSEEPRLRSGLEDNFYSLLLHKGCR